jgi:hypothetical protein
MPQNDVRLQPSLRMTELKQSDCRNAERSQHTNRLCQATGRRQGESPQTHVAFIQPIHMSPHTSYVIFVRISQCAGAANHEVM